MEKDNAYMQRTVDWKKIWLLYWQRLWLIIWITICIAALSAGVYKVVEAINYEGQFYRVSSDYYITFNFDEHENSVDYYNAYTWDTILRDDPIVDEALKLLPKDYTKEEVKASITGEMLGDYRILTVHSTHKDPQRAEAIAAAYETSLVLFADKIDMLTSIERWSVEECQPVEEEDLTANAVLLGAMVGVVIAVFVLAFWCLMDDSVYVERDFTGRFDVPLLGMLTKKGDSAWKQELADNAGYLLKEDSYYMVSVEDSKRTASGKDDASPVIDMMKQMSPAIKGHLDAQGENLTTLRSSAGAILLLPWGDKNGRRCEKLIDFLIKQDCKIAGAVITNADDAFLKKYYFGKK